MSFNVVKPAVTLVCNLAVVLCFLLVVETLSSITMDHKWKHYGANMTQVFGGNFTEFTTPSIIACLALASRSPPANLACHKSSRCVFASVYLPRVGGEQTEGFTCWYFQVCSHEGTLVREGENVAVAEPACSGTRTLTCSIQGMIFPDVPPPRTKCTAPFEQLPFGCMYDSQEFFGTHCEARRYCQELGADLASPETEQDLTDMLDYYKTKHAGRQESHFVGLYLVDEVWRWAANQREAGPPNKGNWDVLEPNNEKGGEDVGFMLYSAFLGRYKIGNIGPNTEHYVLCHVWTTV